MRSLVMAFSPTDRNKMLTNTKVMVVVVVVVVVE